MEVLLLVPLVFLSIGLVLKVAHENPIVAAPIVIPLAIFVGCIVVVLVGPLYVVYKLLKLVRFCKPDKSFEDFAMNIPFAPYAWLASALFGVELVNMIEKFFQ